MYSKLYFLRTLTFAIFALFAFSGMAQKNIYGFKVKDENGRLVSLSKYRGKVLLIVNKTSLCALLITGHKTKRTEHEDAVKS